jgi:transposase
MQRSPQAAALVGKSALVLITERVADVAFLSGQLVTMGLPEVLDRPLPRHGTQRGLSWGWTAVIGLADIVTAGDHRKGSVETSLKGMQHPLSPLTAQVIAPLDFRADRLRHLLNHVRQPPYGPQSDRDLNERRIAIDDWPQDVLRGDATTVSGEHEVTAGGLVPGGQSKEEPTRPQLTVLRGSWAPVGRPLSTAVLSGERADDGFYIPLRERLRTGRKTTGLLFGGDGKRRAVATRASLARPQDVYLSPLPLTGATAEAMDAWITAGVTQGAAGE